MPRPYGVTSDAQRQVYASSYQTPAGLIHSGARLAIAALPSTPTTLEGYAWARNIRSGPASAHLRRRNPGPHPSASRRAAYLRRRPVDGAGSLSGSAWSKSVALGSTFIAANGRGRPSPRLTARASAATPGAESVGCDQLPERAALAYEEADTELARMRPTLIESLARFTAHRPRTAGVLAGLGD